MVGSALGAEPEYGQLGCVPLIDPANSSALGTTDESSDRSRFFLVNTHWFLIAFTMYNLSVRWTAAFVWSFRANSIPFR